MMLCMSDEPSIRIKLYIEQEDRPQREDLKWFHLISYDIASYSSVNFLRSTGPRTISTQHVYIYIPLKATLEEYFYWLKVILLFHLQWALSSY